jgi:lipopolysaccharide transport system permease protein
MAAGVVRSAVAPRYLSYLDPLAMVRSLWEHRQLTWQLARREVEARYRGARLGLLWSVTTPLAMLAIYTFAFAVVLGLRWRADAAEGTAEFALTLFCGLIVFNFFADVVSRAPAMIVQSPNYVKKVVFPVEVFVPASSLAALVNAMIGVLVWLLVFLLFGPTWPHPTVLWLPLVLVPVCLLTAGIAWILSSLGVFVRDIGHAVGLGLQMLFFLTPIFYRIEIVPEPYRWLIALNPLAHAVDDARRVMMWGQPPVWSVWVGSVGASAVVALAGYAFFVKSRRAFADVL